MAPSAAGYSGTPLWRKLGLAPGRRLVVRMAPPAFDELLAGAAADITRLAKLADFDISIQFVAARAELDRSLELLLPHLRPHGVIWLAARDRRRGARGCTAGINATIASRLAADTLTRTIR